MGMSECEICKDLVDKITICEKCGTVLCNVCIKDHDCGIEIKLPKDAFKVFIRPQKPASALTMMTLIQNLRKTRNDKVVIIPSGFDVIIVKKDGNTLANSY